MNLRVALLGVVCFACTAPSYLHRSQEASTAFTNVAVVDVEGGRVLNEQTVLINGRRIEVVAPSAAYRVPDGVRVIDSRGKYVMPGLWDMHAHALNEGRPEYMFPVYIANGVTAIRDMHAFADDPLRQLREYRTAVASGRVLGPRIVGPGFIIDGPGGLPGFRIVTTQVEARQAVYSVANGGANFVKVYSGLQPEVYKAIVEQAKLRGLPVAGHVPNNVGPFEAADAGQRSFEHLVGWLMPFGCASAPTRQELADLRAAVQSRPQQASDTVRARINRRVRELAGLAWDSVGDGAPCRDLFDRMKRNGTWVTPGLVNYAAARDSVFKDPRIVYVPPQRQEEWKRSIAQLAANLPDQKYFHAFLRLVGAMHRQGIGLLVGTDILEPGTYPGFSVHDELVLLTRAGLTARDALRAATLNPAQFLGSTDSLGTISSGKLADFVLLDGDPLADIRNTQRIRAVVANGRYLDRAALDALLAEGRRAALAPTANAPGRDLRPPR